MATVEGPERSPGVPLFAVPPANLPECPDRVRIYDGETGRRLLLPCRRRVCSYCGPVHWRPRALAGFHAGIVEGLQYEYLALLLTAPADAGLEWNAGVQARWHNFVTLLRREWPRATFGFWSVRELQARGLVHVHALLRVSGMPGFLAAGKLRRIARAVGFGEWVGVRACRKYRHGARGAGLYFGKYLLKDYSRRITGVSKLVTFSNGWRLTWAMPERSSKPGRWLFAGTMRAGWRFIGQDVAATRSGASHPAAPLPSWWLRPWQERQRAWAPSVPFGLLTGTREGRYGPWARPDAEVIALDASGAEGRDRDRASRIAERWQ